MRIKKDGNITLDKRIFYKKRLMLLLIVIMVLFGKTSKISAQDYIDQVVAGQIINKSDANNQNINSVHGVSAQDLKRATLYFIADSGTNLELCTGVLVMPVNRNGKVFILTAEHNIKNIIDDEFVLYASLNYEMSHTKDRGNDFENRSITRVFQIRVRKRVVDPIHDIVLLELIPFVLDHDRFIEQAYIAGWNNSWMRVPKVNISHPVGDVKKVFTGNGHIFTILDRDIPQSLNDGVTRYLGTGLYSWAANTWYLGTEDEAITTPQQGSSGSGYFTSDSLINAIHVTTTSANPDGTGIYGLGSKIANSWYLSDQDDLRKYLDPDMTWAREIPGGYVDGLLPVDTDAMVYHHSPELKVKDRKVNLLAFYQQQFLLQYHNTGSGSEDLLGVKIESGAQERMDVILAKELEGIKLGYRIFGCFLSNPSGPELFSKTPYNITDGSTNEVSELNASNHVRNNLFRALGDYNDDEGSLVSLNDILNNAAFRSAKLRIILSNEGSGVNKIKALAIPGETPFNAQQLFDPDAFAQHFKDIEYQSSYGGNNGKIYIHQLSVDNLSESKVIPTGNNGGYLNLVNPNFLIENVLVGYTLDGNEVLPELALNIGVHNATGSNFHYKVWLDYYKTIEDDHYVFTEESTANTVSELLAQGSAANMISEGYPLPNFMKIGLKPGDRKQVRMRVATSDQDNIRPDGKYANGEVEDYLIELVAPTCQDLKPADYETYAAAVLPYCGEGGYRETKEGLADHYQETVPGSLEFLTGKKSNVRFASAKAVGSWYTSGANAVIDNRVDPVPNPADPDFDQSLMAISTNAQEADPNELVDQELKMDIYYPLPKSGVELEDLSALPVIIYHFGGAFMWNTRQSKLTEKTCEWLASRGYIVAAIDYRVGLYGYEAEVAKRTLIRAWQDSRAATKWWRMPENEYEVSDNSKVMWKVDQSKVFALGHSAGGITSQANLYLTETIFGNEIVSGNFLEGIIGNYGYGGLDDSGNPHYQTFDLRAYEPIPCLNIMGKNTCDELSKKTDGSYGTYQGGDAQVGALVSQRLAEYASKDGRVDEAISFAGAVAKTEWMFAGAFRPSSEIHHHDDAVVPWGYDFPFNGGSLPWGSIANIFPQFSLSRVYGGGAMKLAWDESSPRGIFELRTLTGTNEAGMSGQASYHIPQYQFDSNYDDYLAGGDPEIEDQIMYYVDAFFTKDWSASGTASRSAHAANDNEMETFIPKPEKKPVFKIFPNPASDQLNILTEIRRSGPLNIQIYDLQGKKVIDMSRDRIEKGHQLITLRKLGLSPAQYLLTVQVSDMVSKEKLIIQ